VLGVVPPDDALDNLGHSGATLLSTYPSYLAELVAAARRRGLGPHDFQLRRVNVGGEVLSPSVAQAACQTLGVPRIEDTFSMTEVIPLTGRTCSQAHLHADLNTGLTELLDLRTGEPTAPGALGTLVITPYFPYRDCMPVFRYDTRDIVRRLPDEPLTCELAGIPATSQVLGKAGHLLQLGPDEVITPRQLIDAIEALPTAPWPARYRADVQEGRIRLTLPAAAVSGYGEAAARRHFAEAGLDVDLAIVGDDQAASLRRTRSDLHETAFAGQQALVGA
jgi:phenylacetate-coenzyme A ligase PaaK-like adenylate-forming protein